MIKKLKYILIAAVTIGSYLSAATQYFPGEELVNGTRQDVIRVGTAGSFAAFTNPSANVKALYITLVPSGETAAPNNIPTFGSYLGTGGIPHLPATVKDVYIMGDATDFATLVLGDSEHTMYSPAYSPATYALPTPAAGTTVHFLLSNAPADAPICWFQGPLLAGSRLVIEPTSEDPYVNAVMPLGGGKIIVGAPIAPGAGFSALLDDASGPLAIQRHPKILYSDAGTQALITLAEATTFPCGLHGVSLAGAFALTFEENSDIIDPAANSAGAGWNIRANTKVSVFGSARSLPEFAATLAAGGTSQLVIATSASKLPTLLPPLV